MIDVLSFHPCRQGRRFQTWMEFSVGSFVLVIQSVLAGYRSRAIKVWDDREVGIDNEHPSLGQNAACTESKEVEAVPVGECFLGISHTNVSNPLWRATSTQVSPHKKFPLISEEVIHR